MMKQLHWASAFAENRSQPLSIDRAGRGPGRMLTCRPRTLLVLLMTDFMSDVIAVSPSAGEGSPDEAEMASAGEGFLLRAEPARIVVLHLDSLCCLPAMNALFEALGGRIVLVVSSDRFAGARGFLRQLRRNVTHSGVRMTVALGFDIVALRISAFFAPAMRLLVARRGRRQSRCWRSPPELAAGVGAACCIVSDINAAAALDRVRQVRPNLVVSLHFDQILRPAFLQAVACPVVNVHPALLPAHRGPCPAFWTLAAQDERCGVTVHRIVDESIDTGPILARRERSVPGEICMGELDELLFCDGVDALIGLLMTRPIVVRDPPGAQGCYEPFPDRAAVRRARHQGVRLWRLRHAVRLICGLFGWCRHCGQSAG
jgi:methionyl-tRNA formyltransferase